MRPAGRREDREHVPTALPAARSSVRVLKFGGAALRDGRAIRRAAELVRRFGGERPVVVVSAVEDVTRRLGEALARARAGELAWDELRVRHRSLLSALGLPGDLLDRHLFDLRGLLASVAARARGAAPSAEVRAPAQGRRLSDQVLSFGERMSARVVAAALAHEGLRGVAVDAWDAGLSTEEKGVLVPPGRAAERVRRALAVGASVPVVTGFVALDEEGAVTTLGRNGSDLSAVWIAAALGAEEVWLWKEVAGIQRADPRLVPHAQTLERVGVEEATTLARHGAGVLHPEALAPLGPAARPSTRVAVLLRDVREPEAPGTRVERETPERGPLAVVHRPGLVLYELEAGAATGRSVPGTHAAALAGLLEGLAAERAELVWCRADHARVRVLCAPPAAGAGAAPAPLAARAGLATVSVVGRSLAEDGRVAARLLTLARTLEPSAEGWSEPSATSVLVPEQHAAELVRLVHRALFERTELASPRAG